MSNNPKIIIESTSYCLAKNKQGKPCKNTPTIGKKRCYIHGGAPNSGAPVGNVNALKHGRYSKETIDNRKKTCALIRQFKDLNKELEQLY